MSSRAEVYLEFGLTPAQYHGQLDRLRKALGVTRGPNGEDVFTLAIKAIEQARCKVSSIPGLQHLAKEGWEIVGFDYASQGDWFVDSEGRVIQCRLPGGSDEKKIIVRKIEKPKQYRPFANAAEFKPHRDRWIKLLISESDGVYLTYRVATYDDWGVIFGGSKESYGNVFNRYVFDNLDGTTEPFGVEVTS